MKAFHFDPKTLQDPELVDFWNDWEREAAEARNDVLAAWEAWYAMNPRPLEFKYKFRQPVWRKLKRFLRTQVFRNKCAYCESPLKFDRYLGDVEHYRPKGRVTVKDGTGKKQRVECQPYQGVAFAHPGYFWLAYDWQNYIPCCAPCNSKDGKSDQFPAERHFLLVSLCLPAKDELEQRLGETCIETPPGSGLYLLGSRALDERESPLLLRPLNPPPGRKPSDHLLYGLGGSVVARNKSRVGLESINVYKLRRGDLATERQKAQERIRYKYYGILQNYEGDFHSKLREILEPYYSGEEDFASAALDFLDEMRRIESTAREPGSGVKGA